MKYRVVFAKRFQSDGNESELDPTAELEVYLSEGIVADKAFVGRFDPESKHSQEVLDEDDAWLAVASAEMWDYDVADARASEFEDAVQNSESVMEFEVIDETSVDEDEVGPVSLGDGSTRVGEADEDFVDGLQVRSGSRVLDDGPAGQSTVDASADGMGPGRAYLSDDEKEGLGLGETGGIDDLEVISESDPRLGLTNINNKPAEDWAADTGPDATPETGLHRGKKANTAAG